MTRAERLDRCLAKVNAPALAHLKDHGTWPDGKCPYSTLQGKTYEILVTTADGDGLVGRGDSMDAALAHLEQKIGITEA